jgi:large exoprotein involved in heme utilization and adhesion
MEAMSILQQILLAWFTASSDRGVSGTITIRSPELDPTRGLLELPTDVVDASRLIAQTCRPANPEAPQSAFVITGRGGLPPTPSDPGSSNIVESPWITLANEAEQTAPAAEIATSMPAPIVEAQGWQVGEDGEIILVARSPNRPWHRDADLMPACSDL